MIRILFNDMLKEKSAREGRAISLAEVERETGLSRATVSRLSRVEGYNATIEVLDILCRYFECEPADLLIRE